MCVRTSAIGLLCAAGCTAWTPAFATDFSPSGSREFQLRLEHPADFRMTGKSPRKEEAAEFADKPFSAPIGAAARQSDLDPALVHAVIHVESRHNPAARSPKGAVGLMQVLPETAARYGIADPARSVEANLRAGTRYLRELLDLFGNRLDLALAAYNAGEQAVLHYGQRIPPYRETRRYVPAVLEKYRELREPRDIRADQGRRIEYLPGTVLEPPS